MGWTQQNLDTHVWRRREIGVIKTTEDEIPRKSKTGNFETKNNLFFSFIKPKLVCEHVYISTGWPIYNSASLWLTQYSLHIFMIDHQRSDLSQDNCWFRKSKTLKHWSNHESLSNTSSIWMTPSNLILKLKSHNGEELQDTHTHTYSMHGNR